MFQKLTAIEFAIFSLLPMQIGMKHLKVITDNSTAKSYINMQGLVVIVQQYHT